MRPLLPAAAMAATLFLGACAVAPATGEPATGEPATGEPATDVPAAAPLSDGEHFGFVTGVDATAGTIGFDEAVWVSTDAEPNGYRIDNPDDTVVTLPLAEDAAVEVLMSTGDPSTATEVDAAGLQAWFEGPAADQELAFDLEVADGEVISLRFVYRP